MRRIFGMGTSMRTVLVFVVALAAGACSQPGVGPDSRPDKAPETGEYQSTSSHFRTLQSAGLGADYAGFAKALKADDPASMTARLRQHFRGAPFDVYTARETTSATRHRRLIELRSATGRLYLLVDLEKIGNGWSLARYELTRNRAVLAKL